MRYLALATDYDGTLAEQGVVSEDTLAALVQLKASGRRLVLVTGRELDDLLDVLPELAVFDMVVAENGGLLYDPSTQRHQLLTTPADERFAQALAEQGVEPLSVGRAIVATWHPHETTVLATIRDLGLELEIVFNKGAVMVLPTGVNKASGLTAALAQLGLSVHNVVGVGDAENDHAFLQASECSVAVANALPSLKQRVDVTTVGARGAGVRDLIAEILRDDLASVEPRLTRHHLSIGSRGVEDVTIPPYGSNVLLTGPSGSGKSTLATAVLEAFMQRGYQVAIVDPEGDFQDLQKAIIVGSAERAPSVKEVMSVLDKPAETTVAMLLGLPLHDRPAFFSALFPEIARLRSQAGHPHVLLVDEAHDLLPSSWEPAGILLPTEITGLLFVTVHPGMVSPAVLRTIDVVIAVGESPTEVLTDFTAAIGEPAPVLYDDAEESGDNAVFWRPGKAPFRFRMARPESYISRHRRKYAVGDVGEKSFHFRGPDGRLNLRAQNLMFFMQIADGVDDETWLHHLRAGDYSSWVREAIKDEVLSEEIAAVEEDGALSPRQGRDRIRQAIESRYTGVA